MLLTHHLKISYRSLFKHRSFSLVNLLGLAVALCAFLLIWLFVNFQLSYDHFHQRKDQIYQLYHKQYQQGEHIKQGSETFKEVGPVLKDNFPAVVNFTRVYRPLEQLFTSQDQSGNTYSFNESRIYYVDSSFIRIFSFPLIKGNPNTALSQPQSAVITEATSNKYFGLQDPLGKVLYVTDAWGKEEACTVTGVAKEVPTHSHLQFDILLSSRFQDSVTSDLPEYTTYVQLVDASDPIELSSQLTDVINYQLGLDEGKSGHTLALSLIPLTDVHFLQNANDQESVTLLSWIAILVMVIAWINFINLSTVQSLDRAKEVGVRKMMGAFQSQLIRQYTTEIMMMHGIALMLAIALIITFRPLLSNSINIPFSFHFSYLTAWSSSMLLFLMVGVIVSTLYVSFLTASFRPASVLKGKFKHNKSNITTRKVLVVLQFASAIILIVSTFTMLQQLQFMRNAPLGINLDQTLIIKAPKKQVNAEQRFTTFKTKLSQHATISAVSSTSIIPGRNIGNLVAFQRVGAEETESKTIPVIAIDPDFLSAFDIKLLQGHNFSEGDWKNWQSVILNESAMQLLGYKQPEDVIQEKIVDQSTQKKYTIVGIIHNYHQKSLKQEMMPIVYRYNPNSWGYFALKFASPDFQSVDNLHHMIMQIEKVWQNTFESEPFDYFFLDNYFDAQYTTDKQVSKIVTMFTLLAISVACMGLYNLASYTVLQRTKEISIRKVMGASVTSILVLLSKEYLKLILIACVIAIPIANYFSTEWLDNFAYRTKVSWWIFAIPGLIVLFIALLLVTGQTWKAAHTNPADSLKHE